MGILTLLRNAFGRSRKARATEAEGADRSPERTPDPAIPAPTDEHELVAAAFDKVKTPASTGTATEQDSAAGFRAETEGAAEGVAEAVTIEAAEPVSATQAEPVVAIEAEPKVAAEAPEPTVAIEAEPVVAIEAEPTVAAEAAEPAVTAETGGAPGAEVAAEADEAPEPDGTSEAKAVSGTEVAAEPDEAPEPAVIAETKEETEPEVAADAEAAAEKDTEATEAEVAAEEKAEPEEAAQETAPAEDAAEEPPTAEVGPEPAGQPLTAGAQTEAEPTGTKAAGTTAEDPQTPAAGAEEAERTAPAAEAEPEPERSTPVDETTESAPEPESGASEDTPEPTAAEVGTEEAPEAAPPQAADGEDAPQEAPAADDETRTGDAGGNSDADADSDAEGESEAEAEADAEADAGKPTPALPLAELKRAAPALATAYKAAAATLEKTGLTGTRAKLYLVLDRSASMRPYYKDGSAQALADQTLALAAHMDPEATVHVVFFSTEVDGTTDLTLTKDHETKIDDVHAGLGRMGRTSYHAAVEAVLAHYDENAAPGTPALVVFQTDGAPDAKTPATQSLTKAAAGRPAVCFSFVAFGEHDNKAFDYLRKLKTGNTSFFHAGPTPRELTDTELYQGVLATWRP
ncbi:VWA domain-containing protein [Streptomyces sp. AGS-58]|uniref:VWA domain-containing protein n=1 Tax=unclassified Streptomyces TaxID=2593676 RepID=UPI0035A3A8EC